MRSVLFTRSAVSVVLMVLTLPSGTCIAPDAWLKPKEIYGADAEVTLDETLVEGTSSNTSSLFTTVQTNNEPTAYRVVYQKYEGMFYVEFDNKAGRLYLNDTTSLDYEVDKTIIIEVVGSNPSGSGTITITIAVEDANDNSPIFEQTVYRAMITSLDGITAGSYISTVTATDRDSGQNQELSYAITFGDGTSTLSESRFSVGSKTGNITTTGYAFEKSLYVLQIEAMDNGSSRLTGTTTFSMCINNIYCGRAGTSVTGNRLGLVLAIWFGHLIIDFNVVNVLDGSAYRV